MTQPRGSHEISKQTRHRLQELVGLGGLVHEKELRRHLDRLYQDLTNWKADRLSTWDLEERIHRFHNGPARKLYTQHNFRDGGSLVVATASALARGLIAEDDVPAEVRPTVLALRHNFRGADDE